MIGTTQYGGANFGRRPLRLRRRLFPDADDTKRRMAGDDPLCVSRPARQQRSRVRRHPRPRRQLLRAAAEGGLARASTAAAYKWSAAARCLSSIGPGRPGSRPFSQLPPRPPPSGPYVFGSDGALYGIDIADAIRLVPPKDGDAAWRREVTISSTARSQASRTARWCSTLRAISTAARSPRPSRPRRSFSNCRRQPEAARRGRRRRSPRSQRSKAEPGPRRLIRDREGVLYGTVGSRRAAPRLHLLG